MGLLISFVIFPAATQLIFVSYLSAIWGVIYLSSKPNNEMLNLYLAFIMRWAIFVFFTILSLIYIPENTLVAVFLLVYLNTTFNPKLIAT